MFQMMFRAHLLARRLPDRGASLVEYALLLALIAIAAIAGVTLLGESTSAVFDDANSQFPASGNG